MLVFYFNGVGSPAVVQLYGEGIGGLAYVSNDSSYNGERVIINVKIAGVKKENLQEIADRFSIKLRVQTSILALEDTKNFTATRSNDSTIIEYEGSITGVSDDIISIPMIACLGSVKESSIEILELNFYDSNADLLEYDIEYQSGSFKLLGICPEGGNRLINPEGNVQIMSINPNPTDDSFDIELELIEKGNTKLYLTNPAGEKVKTLFEGIPEIGIQNLKYSIKDLPSGSYFIFLETPTVLESKKLEVVK